MEVRCEGCAGCCLDWRALVPDEALADHERRGPHRPLDDVYNLVPLTRDEVRAFLEAGLGDALTPRLWAAEDGERSVEVGGRRVAAVRGRPAFFVGLRKPPKPVSPFPDVRGEDPAWLPTCVFLDPTTLQCRIHGDDLYPAECADYPRHNLALERETECERVERAVGGERLLDDRVGDDAGELLLGPQAIGAKVFCHPRPEAVGEAVDRIARGDGTRADRAEFVAVAAASSPGTLAVSEDHYERARERALAANSWAGRAAREWRRRAGEEAPDPAVADRVEGDRGAPETPGWDGAESGSETGSPPD